MSLLDRLTASTASSDKPKEDVWKVHESLCKEYNDASDEYKRMRAVIDQLGREYDGSKELDYFRRYPELKGMIKRCILHLKLKDDPNHQQQISTGMREKEEKRKRAEHLTGLSAQEISEENEELTEQIKEYKRKISMIRDLIEQMDRNYEASKRYIVIQRYRLMKTMVKTVTHNKWI